MPKLLLNVVTAKIEVLFVFGNKFLNACVKEGADHVAPSIRKNLAITSLTSSGRSVGIVRGCSVSIVRSRTQTMEFSLV
jgi:hypothetical protein